MCCLRRWTQGRNFNWISFYILSHSHRHPHTYTHTKTTKHTFAIQDCELNWNILFQAVQLHSTSPEAGKRSTVQCVPDLFQHEGQTTHHDFINVLIFLPEGHSHCTQTPPNAHTCEHTLNKKFFKCRNTKTCSQGCVSTHPDYGWDEWVQLLRHVHAYVQAKKANTHYLHSLKHYASSIPLTHILYILCQKLTHKHKCTRQLEMNYECMSPAQSSFPTYSPFAQSNPSPWLHNPQFLTGFVPPSHDPVTSLSFYSSIPSLPPPCVWIRVDPRSLTLNSFDPRESWSWLFPCFYSSLGKLGNASNICVCVCLCVHVRFYKCHFVLPAYGSPEDKHTTIVLSYRVLVVKCLTLRKTIYQHTLNPHTPKLTHSWISLSLYLSFCLSFN